MSTGTKVRVIVIGGSGNFGARICRALAADPQIEAIAAGRRSRNGLSLDIAAADFAARLREASPRIVVHCAGPFQNQDYRVAKAALAAGAHYLDLADARDFVAQFCELDHDAKTVGRLALSGASAQRAEPRLSRAYSAMRADPFPG